MVLIQWMCLILEVCIVILICPALGLVKTSGCVSGIADDQWIEMLVILTPRDIIASAAGSCGYTLLAIDWSTTTGDVTRTVTAQRLLTFLINY